MSNLGGYQTLTTLAKKVGGPRNLAIIAIVGGYVIIRTTEGVVKKIISKAKTDNKSQERILVVTADGTDEQGLNFCIGDKYKVLASDGDAVLIEKMKDSNNPYFVSAVFLRSISNY